MEISSGTIHESLVVADGRYLWMYSPRLNQYARTQLDESAIETIKYAASLGPYQGNVDEAKFLREETVEVGGAKIDSYVLQVTRLLRETAVNTWWIDKKRYIVVRDDVVRNPLNADIRGRTVWDPTKLNEPIPDDVFSFTPPTDAQRAGKMN
jgi:outer membrane lipoprotein-sorting protein